MKLKGTENRGPAPGAAFTIGLMLLLILGVSAWAQEPALRKAPASNCAVVTRMPGFPRVQTSSLVEPEILIEDEGVVIRQSFIKDGKIVIPPGGLYYTVRTHWTKGEWRWPLANYPVLLLGKTYYLADTSHNYGVKKDFVVKKGEAVPYGMGVSALELSFVDTSWGQWSRNQSPTFRVLKPSGNYYGSQWTATSGGPFARKSEDALAGKPLPDQIFYQESLLASVGSSYVVVKDVTHTQATVVEWVFSEVKTVDLAERAVTSAVGVGESLALGTYKAKVVSIDPAGKTAQVVVLDAKGTTVAQKTLGPLTDQVLSLLPSNDKELATLLLKHDHVEVGLAAYNSPFAQAGKVKLVGYTGTFQTTMGGAWKDDPRFIIYHDT